MSRLSRRTFLQAAGIACTTGGLAWAAPSTEPRRKLAIVTTEWRYGSHAWHMGERFLVGYPHEGRWHQPPFDVVSAYVDQFPENDLARKRSDEFGFSLQPSIEKALCLGGDSLAVDAVLIIGEHGKYPKSEFAQTQYPRYEFFKQVTDVYRKSGRSVPVFNDKHLSWKWDWAREMVDLSRELKFGFAAGSSLPMTWRMPDLDLPQGCPIDEVVGVAIGGLDSYDFHALEMMQCLVERRPGGETGVKSLQALRGEAVWQLLERPSWNEGGLNPKLFAACLARSQTLKQPETFSHRYPTVAQMREWVADPIAYRYEHNDGLKATLLLLNGLVGDFTVAVQRRDQSEPLSTLFYLPPTPNVAYSAPLMRKAEQTFLTGHSLDPVERTLLTGGLVEAGCQSMAAGQKLLPTPHLEVRYQAPERSLRARQ
jgi:hypothetical protein